jgi:hypothetical protein
MPSYLDGLRAWLLFLKPMLASVEEFTFEGPEGAQFWGIIKRGAIVRQF